MLRKTALFFIYLASSSQNKHSSIWLRHFYYISVPWFGNQSERRSGALGSPSYSQPLVFGSSFYIIYLSIYVNSRQIVNYNYCRLAALVTAGPGNRQTALDLTSFMLHTSHKAASQPLAGQTPSKTISNQIGFWTLSFSSLPIYVLMEAVWV